VSKSHPNRLWFKVDPMGEIFCVNYKDLGKDSKWDFYLCYRTYEWWFVQLEWCKQVDGWGKGEGEGTVITRKSKSTSDKRVDHPLTVVGVSFQLDAGAWGCCSPCATRLICCIRCCKVVKLPVHISSSFCSPATERLNGMVFVVLGRLAVWVKKWVCRLTASCTS
jgi:hypothetical protein